MSMPDLKTVTNAEFTEIDESKESKNVPAVNDVGLRRHQLMVGKSADYIEKIAEELEIDRKLGLSNQACFTADKALEKDIDALVSSKDYIQVSKRDMEKLFKIPMLRGMCRMKNLVETVSGIWDGAKWPISCFALFILSLYPMIVFSGNVWGHKATSVIVFFCIMNIMCWIGECVTIIFGCYLFAEKCKVSFDYLRIKLDSKELNRVDIKIPYGAKLKVLEAKETGIFKDFLMFFPTAEINHHEISIADKMAPLGNFFRAMAQDPAILGVTEDKRMFLIVYWDIKHDVEKVVRSIKSFKKFKVEEKA